MTPVVVFTGGGSAGHVTPNLALITALKCERWQIYYIGSKNSIEQRTMKTAGIVFYAVASGKLRRYFSWKNFSDVFGIAKGIIQSYRLLRQLKATIVFSKGGFVAFPVVFAAWLNRIPVIAHESDLTPGLANRLSFPFVNQLCVNFPATKAHFSNAKRVVVTGTPIRPELFQGIKTRGLALCQFNDSKPCLLIMGGGQGADKLNLTIRQALPSLIIDYQIIHLCGPGKVDTAFLQQRNYYQFDYVTDGLADLLAASDIIISRSGANSLCEILALQKLHILVPLSAKISRGDQIHNAAYFQQQGISVVVDDDTLTIDKLLNALNSLNDKREMIKEKLKTLAMRSATDEIIFLIKTQLACHANKANQ